jgi:hypothetical protein
MTACSDATARWDGSDCIDFGIALLDDCLDASLSFYGALHACGIICGYLDIDGVTSQKLGL